MGTIRVIGTSHIAQQSIAEIQRAAGEQRPDIIAVELDAQRLHALLHRQRTRIRASDLLRVGVKGALFAWIGSAIQRRLGKIVGTVPGADMLHAVKLAQRLKIPLALIDRELTVSLQRFSQTLSWKERLRFLADIVRGMLFPRRELAMYGLEQFDLRSVPAEDAVRKMILRVKQRYPNVHRVLIEERNRFMIARLKKLVQEHPDEEVLVVVGAGHKEAIEKAFRE